MEEKEYIYIIYTGCFHEELFAAEFYKDKDRAIKFALMRLEEKKKDTFERHGNDPDWQFKENFRAYELSEGRIILCFQNCINEISVCKQEIL